MKKEAALIAHNNTHSTSRIFRNVALIRLHDDVSDRVKNRLKAIEDACYECRQQVDDMYKLIVSKPSVEDGTYINELDMYASEWVNGNDKKWSNNNNEVGDNYGSFVAGYKKAKETDETELADIRNKLGALKNLIQLIERGYIVPDEKLKELVEQDLIPVCKESIEYLANGNFKQK